MQYFSKNSEFLYVFLVVSLYFLRKDISGAVWLRLCLYSFSLTLVFEKEDHLKS